MPDVNIYAMTDTWNNGSTVFSAIKMDVTDTASDAESLLLDLRLGGATRLNLRKDGWLRINPDTIGGGIVLNHMLSFTANSGGGFGTAGINGFDQTQWSYFNGFVIASNFALGFASSSGFGNPDASIIRDGAGILSQRVYGLGSMVSQENRLYDNYTDSSNNRRLAQRWSGGVAQIIAEHNGTGGNAALSIAAPDYECSVNLKNYQAVGLACTTVGYQFQIAVSGKAASIGADYIYAWTNLNARADTTIDTALARKAAKVVQVTDGATGNGGFAFITKAGAFVAADIPTDSVAFGYDSSGGTRQVLMNQGGTLYKVTLT